MALQRARARCRLRPVSARRVRWARTLRRGSPPARPPRARRRAPSSCRRRRRLRAPRPDRDSRGSDRPPRAGARSDAARRAATAWRVSAGRRAAAASAGPRASSGSCRARARPSRGVVNARPGTPGGGSTRMNSPAATRWSTSSLMALDRHLPHRPRERIPQQRPFVDDRLALQVPVLRVRDGGARRHLRHVVFAAARALPRRLHDAGRLIAVGLRQRAMAALHLLVRAVALRFAGLVRGDLRGAGAAPLRSSRGGPESAGGGDSRPRGTPACSRESRAARWRPRSIS